MKQLNLELANRCNMHCTLCNFKPSRTAFMDIQLVAKLLLEVKEGGFTVDLLSLSHGGESLLHPNFKDIIFMLSDFKTDLKDVSLTTNGMLLTPDMIDYLVEHPVLTRIIVSIDGYDKESYKKFRPDSNYDLVVKNLKYLTKHYPRDRIEIANGLEAGDPSFDYGGTPLNPEYEIQVNSYNFHTWLTKLRYVETCPYGNSIAAILSNGLVAKCCYDLNGEYIIGNFNKDLMSDIMSHRVNCHYCH